MDNNYDNPTGASWNQPASPQFLKDVPNATAAFVLGIVSLCTTVVLCCCYGYVIGLITSIIGLVLGNGAIRRYNVNPSEFTEKSFNRAKTGRLLNIIGLILSLIVVAFVILVIILKLTGNLPDELERNMNKYNRYNYY